MTTVSIVQRILPHYRLAFFERLHVRLQQRGIDLRLWYGQEQPGTRPGSVDLSARWVHRIQNRYLFERGDGSAAVWQPCLSGLRNSRLVIAEHATRLLINYPLALMSSVGGPRFALWGHGANLQSDGRRAIADTVRERFLRGAHWWFAYTAMSARLAENAGFPSERITVVNNSIDTGALSDAVAAVAAHERSEMCRLYDLRPGSVGIFCGRLVAEKRLDLIRAAGDLAHARRPGFRLLMVGDGPLEAEARRMTETCPWLRYIGPRYGSALAPYLAVSDFLVMPGLVGLVAVDSFAAGLPLITTDFPGHSPEIEYLRHGENAWITPMTAQAFAQGLVDLMDSPEKLATLREGTRRSALEYTLERMVDRFSAGVISALAH
jgi:glycosyltransferase involved in cell wall biosynthesis